MSHAAAERQTLAATLAAAGPDAPTLCEGWTTRDLAAHLVVRERRPDTLPGLVVGRLSGWTDRVRRGYAARPYGELVDLVRTGPGRTGWAAVPAVDAAVNLTEHFVHCEDVLRAAPGWEPRVLPAHRQEALWRTLAGRGRMLFRSAPVGVTLEDGPGRRRVVADRQPMVTVRGEPAELVLFAFGRGDHARVTLDGPADAVARLRGAPLGL